MRKFKCETCFTEHGGFHICIPPSQETLRAKHDAANKLRPHSRQVEFRQTIARVRSNERWEKYREQHRERDRSIMTDFENGVKLTKIAQAVGLSHQQVRRIIERDMENE